MTAESPFDVGLQPERTLLAWRRTALVLAVASAVGVRLAMVHLGDLAVVLGAIGILSAAGTYIGATVRYRKVHRSLVDSQTLVTVGGRSLASLALSAILLATLALVLIIVGGLA